MKIKDISPKHCVLAKKHNLAQILQVKCEIYSTRGFMKTFLKAVAAIVLAVSVVCGSVVPEFHTYFVKYSPTGEQFVATKYLGGWAGEEIVIEKSVYIHQVIGAIRWNANGEDCVIIFQENSISTAPLNIGDQGIFFTNRYGGDADWQKIDQPIPWGKITILGGITSEVICHNPYSNRGAIMFADGVSAEIRGAYVANTAVHCPAKTASSNTIVKIGAGTLTITEGNTIYSVYGHAIASDGAGRIVIKSGEHWSPRIIAYRNNPAIYISSNIMGRICQGNANDTALVILDGGIGFPSTLLSGRRSRGIDIDRDILSDGMLIGFTAILNESAAKVAIIGGKIAGVVEIRNKDSELILKGGEIYAMSGAEVGDTIVSGVAIISAGTVSLGSTPLIEGSIRAEKGKLRILDGFFPDRQVYTLNNSYEADDIVVVGGAEFLENFRVVVGIFTPKVIELTASNDNLITKRSGHTAISNRTNRNTANFAFAGISNGQINLQLQAGNYTAELYNLQGRMINRTNIAATNGLNATGLRTDNLAKGVFFLNVKQAGNSVLRQKISVR